MSGPEKRIPVAGPSITQKEIDYVADAAANAWYEKAGIYHDRFESAFASWVGTEFAMALPSCTSALHLSLCAAGVGEGDEVVVPDLTWIATAAPITYTGAATVFADVDAKTWCLSAESFRACVTERTKAVIPVDLYGHVADMDAIRAVADEHGIAVIEDAAQAAGSEYRGKLAGSLGDTGCFSFHGSKTMTTGEGGMLVTNDVGIRDRALFLRDHGRAPGDVSFRNEEVAFKYKMSSLQAALGLAQLERIDELVARKREIFEWYRSRLSRLDGLVLNGEAPGTKSSYWMTTIILPADAAVGQADFIRLMGERKIDCRPFFHPLSSIPAYESSPHAAAARERNRVSRSIGPRGVNLPSGLELTEEDAARVCDAVEKILFKRAPGLG